MTPDQVTSVTFETKLRGVDLASVRAHLVKVSDALNEVLRERDELRNQLFELEAQSKAAPVVEDVPAAELDEEDLTRRLGQEAARVLAEARAAAADRLKDAEAEAEGVVAESEELYAKRSVAADAEAERIRNEANAAADSTLALAEADAQKLRESVADEIKRQNEDASSRLEAAELQAEHLVREAETMRKQILQDLARRRSSGRKQVEQLRAGRERLLKSHDVLRRTLDEIAEELAISMSEARAAAETAGHMVSDSTLEEIEAEIETAKMTGLLDTGPLPIVESKPKATTSEGGPAPVEEPKEEVDTAGASPESPADEERLADVVPLDQARGVVDTGSHPAARKSAESKPAATVRPASEKSQAAERSEADERGAASTPTQPEAESIFERMRKAKEAEAAAKEAEAAKKAKDKAVRASETKSAKKKTGKDKTAKRVETVEVDAPAVDAKDLKTVSDNLARRLKRVLADEQSELLSGVRTSESEPVALLPSAEDHRERYNVEVRPALISIASLASGKAVGEMPDELGEVLVETETFVGSLRDTVSELEGRHEGEDADESIARLREIYREFKTRRIADYVEQVCAQAVDIAGS